MTPAFGRHAIVPLVAVTVILFVSGVHGRHTHDPDRAAHALDILAPTDDPRVAGAELDAFFQTGWVGWDVKTAVEISCGTVQGRNIADPVRCVALARSIAYDHECREQSAYRTYTWLAWAAVVPLLLAVLLGASVLAGIARRKRTAD